MKKLILAIIVIVALVAGIGPKIVAGNVDTQLNDVVAKLDSSPGYQAEIIEIQQSWFSTQAKIKLGLDMSAMPNAQDNPILQEWGELAIIVDFDATHGPVLIGEQAGLGWAAWSVTYQGDNLRDKLDWTDSTPFYQLQARANLLGSSYYQDRVVPFNVSSDSSNATLTFSGFQGEGNYSGGELTYNGLTESLLVNADDVDANMHNLSVDMNMTGDLLQAFEGALYDSAAQVAIEHIEFSNKQLDQQGGMDNFYLKTQSIVNADKTLADVKLGYGVGKFNVNDYQGSDAVLDVELNNLSAELVQQYQQQMQTINSQDPEQIMAQMNDFIQQHLLAQLKANPEFNITRLSATLPEGKFNSHAHISFSGIDALPDDLQDASFWLKHLKVIGKIDADKAIAEMIAHKVMQSQFKANPQTAEMDEAQLQSIIQQQTPVMLGNFVQQGLLVETEQGYTSDITIENGTAKINSLEVPLDMPAQ
ncbi:YdgA family protein [Neptunicella sp. SCSIO 80796]|uniref:YdgA family protein n=1 Tax=Neptunicella plasticusilytica TaxID=3117012 RepID=UPI003A4E57CB